MPNIRIHTFPALLTAISLTDSKLIAHPYKTNAYAQFLNHQLRAKQTALLCRS